MLGFGRVSVQFTETPYTKSFQIGPRTTQDTKGTTKELTFLLKIAANFPFKSDTFPPIQSLYNFTITLVVTLQRSAWATSGDTSLGSDLLSRNVKKSEFQTVLHLFSNQSMLPSWKYRNWYISNMSFTWWRRKLKNCFVFMTSRALQEYGHVRILDLCSLQLGRKKTNRRNNVRIFSSQQ